MIFISIPQISASSFKQAFTNGVVRWIIPSKTGDYFETAAKYSDGNVFAAMDSHVFSINPLTGKINWQQYDLNSNKVLVIGNSVFDSKTVYTVSREVGGSNRLMAADKSTGAFKYSTQPPYLITQAFSVVNNRIYYMSSDYFVTLDATTGTLQYAVRDYRYIHISDLIIDIVK